MASLAIAQSLTEHGMKALAVIAPWVYKWWNTARKKPIVAVQRTGPIVTVSTPEDLPIMHLSLRVFGDAVLARSDVKMDTSEFAGCNVFDGPSGELRVSLVRFTSCDSLSVSSAARLTVQVIESEAVPVRGPVGRLVLAFDYLVATVLVLVLVAFISEPAAAFLFGPPQQSQDNSNIEMRNLVVSMVAGFAISTIVLVAATIARPGRAIVFRRERSLTL